MSLTKRIEYYYSLTPELVKEGDAIGKLTHLTGLYLPKTIPKAERDKVEGWFPNCNLDYL